MRLADCIAEIQRLTPDVTPEEIADILWLATFMGPLAPVLPLPEQSLVDQRLSEKPAAAPDGISPQRPTTRSTAPSPTPEQPADTDSGEFGLYPVPVPGDSAGLPASLVRVAAAKPLRNGPAIGRALRRLKRRVPSRTQFIPDIAATVDRIAEGGPLAPVLRAARERWLDLVLIIDEGVSMRTWDTTLAALRRLLEHHGAFRRFQVSRLQADTGTIELFRDAPRSSSARRPLAASELVDALGRRLILVASDCISMGWRNGNVLRQLQQWGECGPVAILQMLPQRLWPATALGSGVIPIRAAKPGARNARLSAVPTESSPWDMVSQLLELTSPAQNDGGSASLVPIVTLEEWSLRSWAAILTAQPDSSVMGIDLEQAALTSSGSALAPDPAPIPAAERVKLFRKSSTPTSVALAYYLAETPLSLPVMRLVQEVMLPDSTQTHLAEVVLGGLMKALPEPPTGFLPDALMFEFHPGVDEYLRRGVVEADRDQVRSAISTYMSNRAGSPRDFLAAELAPGGTAMVDPLSKAFGKLKSRTAGAAWTGNRRWVLVAGTGRRHDLPDHVGKTAEAVGRRLALDGYNLMIGEWPGVDYLAASSYVEAMHRLRVPVAGHLRQHVEADREPDFPAAREGGTIVQRDGNEIENADVTVLIGGEGSTMSIFEACVEAGKTVLPIAASGGDARAAFEGLSSGGRPIAVNLRLLRYLSEATSPAAIADRLSVVLKVLTDTSAGNVYREWALSMFGLFFRSSGSEPLLYQAELLEAGTPASQVKRGRRSLTQWAEKERRREIAYNTRLEHMLPAAVEWLRYDYMQLSQLKDARACWPALAALTPLVVKYLPAEARSLIRGLCATSEVDGLEEALELPSTQVEPAEVNDLIQRVFGLTRSQFNLQLRLWCFSTAEEASVVSSMAHQLDAPSPDDLFALLIAPDAADRHLACFAFNAFPLPGAADVLLQSFELDKTSNLAGISLAWANALYAGFRLEPAVYLNHSAVRALLDTAFSMSVARDLSEAWNVILAIANEGDFGPSVDNGLAGVHVGAVLFMLHRMYADDEWEILRDLEIGRSIRIPSSTRFQDSVRRLRNRRMIEGGRVSTLEPGEDLGRSFWITDKGRKCLLAREHAARSALTAESPLIAGFTRLLLENLTTPHERTHMAKLLGVEEDHFVRTDTLIQELRRLRNLGMLTNTGTRMANLPPEGGYLKFLSITAEGREYQQLCRHLGIIDDVTEESESVGWRPLPLLKRCIEFLVRHFVGNAEQGHLTAINSSESSPYFRSRELLDELEGLRSLGLISPRGPLHDIALSGGAQIHNHAHAGWPPLLDD